MRDCADALVSIDWLAQALQTQLRPIVLHGEWTEGGTRCAYRDQHIPGALCIDTDWLEDGYPTWRLLPPELLQRRFGDAGLRAADTIVVYAEQYPAACRVWWVLSYCGATDVRVLCGGLNAWRAAGLPVSTEPVHRAPADFSALVQSALLADRDAAQAAAQAGCLIDVRSGDEYRGLRSGYSYLERAGRIAGALHADAQPLTDLLDRRDLPGIAAYWQASGVLRPTDLQHGKRDASPALVFYCGGGWRSSVACFCAQLLGMTGARNYSDGWCGWSTRYVQESAASGTQSGATQQDDEQLAAAGGTPGWRQETTDNPIASG